MKISVWMVPRLISIRAERSPAIRWNYVTNELPRLLAYTEDQDTDWYYVIKVELALIFINYIIHGGDWSGQPGVRPVKKSDKASRADQIYLWWYYSQGWAVMAPDRKISTNLTEMIIITALRERERERELSELKLLTAVTHVLVGNIWRGTWQCILGKALGTWLIFCKRSDNSTLNISSALCRLTDKPTGLQCSRCDVM